MVKQKIRQRKLRLPNFFRSADFFGLIAILVVSASLIFPTLSDMGITYDEEFYFERSRSYLRWIYFLRDHKLKGIFDATVINRYWSATDHHPALAKILMGITWRLFNPLASQLFSYRFANAALFLILQAALYVFALRNFGRMVALFSTFALLFMPRVFGHAHIAALDTPMTVMWFLCTCAFLRAMESVRWRVYGAILYGLALNTKINAFILPLPLALWGLIYYRREAARNFLYWALIAPVVWFVTWPWLWRDTFSKLFEYLSFHFASPAHSTIPVYYFGQRYMYSPAPWHYPFILSAVTIPATIFLVGLLGVIKVVRERNNVGLLVLFSFVMPLLICALPHISKYDGVRLFLPAFPFFALLSGIGLKWMVELILASFSSLRTNAFFKNALIITLITILLIPGALATCTIHPYELSYYNELVGGVTGAHKIGMESTYWGDSFAGAFDFINHDFPRRARFTCLAFQPLVLLTYKEFGILRRDIEITGVPKEKLSELDYAALICRQGGFNKRLWKLYRYGKPTYTISVDDVPLLLIYEKSEFERLKI
jgi:4-amino-4-deoxy-L-arabinose transferase-like glycosyltransferase